MVLSAASDVYMRLLAQGDSEILDIEPFEIRKFDGYVELNEPFYECSAVINWDKSK